ncbi:gp53-like domain-containing protein [Achromobacter sp. PD1]|uniref:gp53-like domain-containing protein n=1 Tax=Achromobacter sp. PD1 TaxID=3399125 RepID=UPI003AF9791E
MATNQILQFGASAGANVLTPAEYSALVARASGFLSGVAKSKEVNTPLRQSAFVAAMIGQFIADTAAVDVLDDGNLPGLLAKFVAALKAQMQGQVATTAQAQAMTDDTVLMTPKKLADAFAGTNQSLTSPGYQKLPGGLILQWSKVLSNINGFAPWTYPISFPTEVLGILATAGTISTDVDMSATLVDEPSVVNCTTSVFVGGVQSSVAGQVSVRYLAIGR